MIEGEGRDSALVNLARRGDESAFRALYRQHTPRAFAIVMRMLAWRRADAEDVVQEAWLRAAAGLARFRGDSTFGTWFTGIAIRCAHEYLRRRPLADDADAVGRLAARDGPRDLALDLERGVAALPDGYRTVLVLHDVHGYTHGEIARLLDIDEGTSKSQLFRARRAVRERLTIKTSETGT
jgi:RNA polymerase sigma-70 factor (ECF subfamily)